MPFGGWFKGRQKTVASATAFSVATAGFLVAAFQSDGVHAADLALNDGGVWVTKPASGEGGYVGRVNAALKSLDARVSVKGVADVSQVGSSVLVLGGAPTFIDPVTMATAGAIELGKPSVVAHGGGGPLTSGLSAPAVVAIVDADGKAWVLPAEQAAINTKKTKPIKDLDLGEDASAIVGDDGAAHLVSVDDRVVLTYPPRPGGLGEPQRRSLPVPDDGLDGEVSVTAVGTTPVVLSGDRLLVTDGPEIDLAGLGAEAVLQQPGPPSDGVVVATDEGLYSVPLDGAEPRLIADVAAAQPAAPVWAQGCVYAVWSGGSQPYASKCGDDEARTAAVPDSVGNDLVLRENRGLVVIQGMDTGNATLPFEGDLVIDDWEAASPPEPIEQQKGDTSKDQTTRARSARRLSRSRRSPATTSSARVSAARRCCRCCSTTPTPTVTRWPSPRSASRRRTSSSTSWQAAPPSSYVPRRPRAPSRSATRSPTGVAGRRRPTRPSRSHSSTGRTPSRRSAPSTATTTCRRPRWPSVRPLSTTSWATGSTTRATH